MRRVSTIITYLLITSLLTVFGSVHAQTIQIGSGTSVTSQFSPSPINIYSSNSVRSQMVYTSAELNAAGITDGKIIRMGFYIEEAPFYDLPNFTIKMRHTTATNASSHDAGALTTVYSNVSYAPTAGGFDMLTFDTPFDWNGTDNILVDICFDPVPLTNSSGRVRYSTSSVGYRYTYSSSSVCNNNTLFTTTTKPNVQFTFGGNVADDAGVSQLDVASCVGNNPITATIFNVGNNQITNVDIHWSINGVAQSTVNYNTTLDTIGSVSGFTANVVLGNVNLASLGAGAIVQVWTESPNGNPDSDVSNDTMMVEIKAAMGGIYTIGGASPDFATIQEAVDSLRNNGVCDDVIFNLRNGTYTEQVLMEAYQNDGNYTVTFQSESGNQSDVTIVYNSTSSSTHYTIHLDGIENVIFRNLILRSLNTSNNRIVYFTNNASSVSFYNCQFAAPYVTYDALVQVTTGLSENLKFYDCSFYGGGYGISYNPSGIGDTVVVERDTFFNQYNAALSIYDCAYLDVNNNYISGEGSTTSSYNGMYIYNCDEYLSINNNRIYNIKGTSGINMWYCNGNISAQVYNNFIHTKGINSTYGIYPYFCDNISYDHNSIQCHSTGSSSSGMYLVWGSGNTVRNNISYNSNAGYAYYVNSTSVVSVSDNNNWYGENGAVLGYYNAAAYTNLTDWIAAFGLDSNSYNVNPYFLQDSSYQVNQAFLNGNAAAIGISTDIEGATRDVANPDIGAYEFTPMGIDAAIASIITPEKPFATGFHDVKVVLQNAGGTTLTSANIEWRANGMAQTTVNWAGSLASGDTVTVTLGSIDFGINQGYDFEVNTFNPNGVADAFNGNDTASINDVYGALSGIYTIGGTSPDFGDFTSVATQLNLGGVVGSTIFSVRNGTYVEQLVLNEICGADTVNTITFESENGDPSLVTLEYSSAGSSTNYTVYLNGTDWVTFQNMSFANNSFTYRRVFSIDNGANRLNFINNHLSNSAGNTTSTNSALIDYSGEVNEYQTYMNNVFEGGSYGVYLDGTFNSGDYLKGVVFKGNQFNNQYYTGLYAEYCESIVIDSNEINSNSTYSSFYGLWLTSCENGVQITKNKIITSTNGDGLYLNDCDGTASNHNLVANNFIKMTGTSTSHDNMYIYYSDYTDIYNNTLNSLNTGSTSRALQVTQGSNIQIINNICRNVNGYPIYISSSSSVSMMDYNNYYTNGVNAGYWNGSAVTSFADWQTNTSMDVNSTFEDPLFLSDTSYQIANSSLNDAGTPLGMVTTDIEGEPRDGTSPDIGADEFMLVALDAGISFVSPPAAPFAPTSHDVTANLKNFGADTLTSTTIYWTVNGVAQATVNWTGALGSGDTTTVTLGAFNFANKVNYNIEAFTSMPNGMADNTNLNDTSSVNDVVAAFAGSYTLGGVTPDFTNFNNAAYWLSLGGVIADVNVDVRDGTYNEQVTFPPIPGVDSANQLVFASESGDSTLVNLQYNSGSSNNYVLKFGGADWTTFQNMTIQALSTSYGRTVVLDSNSQHITIQNNVLQGSPTNGTSSIRAIVYSYDNGNQGFNGSYLTVQNCRIEDGDYGVYLRGYSTTNLGTDIQILNNDFINQHYYSIDVRDHSNITISGNYITTTGSYSFGYRGIYADDLRNGYNISNNRISGFTGNYAYGLYLNDCDGASGDLAIVANNFIQTGGTTSTERTCFIQNCDYIYFYHNSINSTNTDASSVAFYYYNNRNSNFYNNIFAHSGGGYAIYYGGFTSSTTDYDYNNLYTTGANIGYYSGGRGLLADWQTASGEDANSISIDPIFTDSADLHVSAIGLDKAGTATPEVTTDIDGESRNPATPDIGADEFSTDPDDAGLATIVGPHKPFPSGINDVYVKILNNGTNDLDSVRVNWTVNGVLQTTYYHVNTIASGGMQDSVSIGTYNFLHDSAHHLVIWTSHPNGNADADNSNDTATVQNLYPALGGTYFVGGGTPNYLNFTEAVTALERGGVVGNTVFYVRSGTYNEQIEIDEICGASSTNDIIFASESADSTDVILTYSANSTASYTLRLNGADWMTFEAMTIQGTNVNYSRAIEIDNGSFNNKFTRNILESASTTAQNINHAIVYSTSLVTNGNNQYENNRFVNGSYGIYQNGNYNSGNYEQGFSVLNNKFENQSYRAMYLYRQNGFTVAQNTITTNTTTSNYYAMYLSSCSQGFNITKNNIYGITNGYGIYLVSSSGISSDRATIANNFISVGEGSSINNYCYYSYFSSYLNVYHNNMRNGSSNASARAFYIYGGNNVDNRNNIFVNEGGGYAIYNRSTSPFSTSDYNDLFTSGANLGYWNGSTVTDLTAWQGISSQDANSISIDPSFTSASDLHVAQNALDSAAVVIASITDDIDGDARNATHPDIGADEFGGSVTDDIGVASFSGLNNSCGLGIFEPITVNITNFGTSPATGFDVTVVVDDTIIVTENVGALNIGAGNTEPYTFTATFDFSVEGIHSVRAFTSLAGDANMTNDTASTTVEHYSDPNISFNPSSPSVCAGDQITISAFGGNTYQWNVVSSFNQITVSPLVTTTYYVTVTNSDGCTSNDSIEIVVTPLPTANASNGGPYCDGATATLNAGGGTNYSWSGPNGFTSSSASPSLVGANPIQTGNYYVTVTDGNGCTDSASTFLVINTCTEICNNGIDDDNDGKIDCDDEDCYMGAISFVADNNSICNNDSVTLYATGGASYLWTGGSTADSLVVYNGGTYSVTITGMGGCDTVFSETITKTTITATASSGSPYCTGQNVQLMASGGVLYDWSGPNGFISGMQNPVIPVATAADSGTYTVYVYDVTGTCVDSATTTVSVTQCQEICNNGIDDDNDGKTDCDDEDCFDAPVFFGVNGATAFCIGDSVTLGASGGATYLWNTGAITDTLRVGTSGIYSVTITSSSGCDTTFSQTITVNPQPTATASSGSPYCVTDNIQLNANGGVSYAWTGPNGFTSNNQNPTRSNSALVDGGTYTVIVTDANGCKDTATTMVAVNPCVEICGNGLDDDFDGKTDCDDTDCHDAISLTAQSATTFCIGDSVILKAAGGAAYSWSTGGATAVTDDSIIVKTSGTYSVTITSSSGCDSTMSMVINVNGQPTATASNSGPYCIGGDIELDGEGGVSYVWTGANGFMSTDEDPVRLGSTAGDFGEYTLIVTDANGCKDTATTTVSNTGNSAPTLAYTNNLNFTNSIVSPTQGDPYTTFRFEVEYTDADGDFPATNEPQVWMDAENNGSYFNTNDRVLFMQELDPTDLDVTDGKIYYFETIGLPLSTDWDSEIRASDGNGCDVVFGGFDAPDVFNSTDITIFANDITFSDENPDPSDTITISTVIHNYSNLDANNFIVRLLNQNDSTYQDDTVAVVPALGSITLQWTWPVSDTPSWNPMQVILDLNDVINEPNELDNTALRPFTAGNFVIGGDIITNATASPSPTYTQRTIRVSGNAVYTDLAVTLQDSSVAGATVTFNVYDSTGTKVMGPYSTYTNSLGDFSYSFYQTLFAPATYTIIGNTTDFTLTDTFSTTFELLPPPPQVCLPDLRVTVSLSDYKFPVGTTVTGSATVYNNGCDTAEATQLFIELPDGTPVPGPFAIPQLLPGESYNVSLGNMTFNTIGQTYIKGYADYGNVVAESNEFNNTHTRTIIVLPALPDIVAKGYSFPTVIYACDTACFSFKIGNDGGIGASAFLVGLNVYKDGVLETIYTTTVDTLAPCRDKWLSFCHLLGDPNAVYTFSLFADSTNLITEYREDNNRISTNRTSTNCLPDLQVVECRWSDNRIEVIPVDPSSPGTVGLRAEIYNGGNLGATNFDVKFYVINTAIPDTSVYTVNYPGTLAGGDRDTVSIYGIANIPYGNHDLVVVIDEDDVINERSENNNREEVDFCYEFSLARYCTGGMWWDRTHTVFNPVQMFIRVKNTGVFDASAVGVKFEVSGPGIAGWQLIDQGTQTPAYSTMCNCNYGFILPTPYAFQQPGTYQVRMTVDPDGVYTECDETNNVMIVDVNVVQVPDMRVLSQYINPSLLNPDLNQNVTFDVTYENLGVSNVGDTMELFIMVDEVPLDSMQVGGLTSGDFATVNFTTPWSSNLVGAHVARVIIDNDDEIAESNELNNEATRALIIGQLPDLYPTDFCTTDPNPALNSATLLTARIHNSGDTSCNADVQFYYVNANLDTILIGSQSVFVDALDSTDITYPWNNVFTPTTLILRIVNADPEEARTDNNEAVCFIGTISVTIDKDRDADCQQDGQATATVQGGTAPYTYAWSNGHNTNILTAPSGTYTLTVTDLNGLQATDQVTINQISSLTASYSLQDTCSPTNLFLAADKGANSYVWSGPNGFTAYDSDTTINGATTSYTGVYTVTATYSGGCQEVAAVYVEIDSCCTIDTTRLTAYTCILDSEGTFVSTLTGSDGCDSIVISTYTYSPPFVRNDSLTICSGDSVVVNGNIYKTTGNYSDTLAQMVSGCDSIINTYLIVRPEAAYNNDVSICAGDSVMIGMNVYKTTGSHTDTLQTVNGCDSIVTINLSVKPTFDYNNDVEICQGDSIVIGNNAYYTSGTHIDTLTATNGCDSVVTINLTVKPTYTYNDDVGICPGDSVIINNTTLQFPDTYIFNLTAANGCDSTVTINLFYYDVDTTTITAQTCDVNQVGTTSTSYQNRFGCDSLVITNTVLVPTYRDTSTVTICEGDNYIFRNNAYTMEGQYIDTAVAQVGCDSIFVLNLNVASPDTITLMSTTCHQDSAGVFTSQYTNQNGCDSTVIETITLLPTPITTIDTAICEGDTFRVNYPIIAPVIISSTNQVPVVRGIYTMTGTYQDTLSNGAYNGCDSIVITNLTVHPIDTSYDTTTTCNAASVGSFAELYQNQYGCDSLVITTVTLLPTAMSNNDVGICPNGSYTVNGNIYTMAGTYTDTITGGSYNGCDSIVTTNISILNTDTTLLTVQTCDANQVGMTTQILTNQNGCDSVIITTTVLVPTYRDTSTVTICEGNNYIFRNNAYTMEGQYIDTAVAQVGCDSIFVLNLNVASPDTITLMSTTCHQDSTGVFTSQYTNQNGCDSIVIETVTLLPTPITTIDTAICEGDTFRVNYPIVAPVVIGNTNQVPVVRGIYTMTGTYQDTLSNAAYNGCDSIVITNLTVHPIDTSYDTTTTCNVASVGSFSELYQNQYGCDSLVITTVTLLPTAMSNNDVGICPNGSYTVNGNIYTMSGTYTDTITGGSYNGCDSIVTTNISILNTDTTLLTVQTCDADQVGTSTQALTNQSGCDSVIVTTTVLVNAIRDSIEANICVGGAYQVGINTYSSTGIYNDTLQAASGCDSIITLDLTVHVPILETVNTESCNPADVGTVVDTFQNVYNCDSLIRTTVTTLKPSYAITIDSSICQGDSVVIDGIAYNMTNTYVITLGATNDCDSVITLNLTVNSPDTTLLNMTTCSPNGVGVFTEGYQNQYGCDSLVITTVTLLETPHDTINATICEGSSYMMNGVAYSMEGSYLDTIPNGAASGCDSLLTLFLNVADTNVTNIFVESCNPQDVGVMTQVLANVNGCDSTVITTTTLKPSYAITIDSSICQGDSVVIDGMAYNMTNTYVITLGATNDCDSVITLNLTVNSPDTTLLNMTTCSPNGVGVFTEGYQNQHGCDSLVITTVTLLETPHDTINATICGGSSYVMNNVPYSMEGVYIDTIPNGSVGGCDSLLTLFLNVADTNMTNIFAESCNPQDVGVMTQVFANMNGCDSTVIVTTTLIPSYQITNNVAICYNDVYVVGNNSYNTEGQYVDTLTALNGCDSIITTQLTINGPYYTFLQATTCDANQAGQDTVSLSSLVNGCDSFVVTTTVLLPVSTTTIDTTICENEVYYFSGATSTFDSTGIYIDTLYGFAQGGCDSVIITNLTVLSVDTTITLVETCDSSLLGTTFTTYTGQNGCDSVVRTIYFAPASITQTFQNIAICPGDTFTMGNNNYTVPGTYIDTIYQPNSCYFLVNTELTYRDIDTTYIQSITCSSINVGVNTSTLTGSDGCDSVVIEMISYAPPAGTIVDTAICSGQTYYISGGGIYDSTGIYIDTLYGFGQGGCDSVVITNLTVLPPDTTLLTDTTCNPTQPDMTTVNLTSMSGCDSIVVTTWIYQPDTIYTFGTTCDSSNIGVFVFPTTNTNCTEIIVNTITLLPPSVNTIDSTICSGQNVEVYFETGVTPNIYSQTGSYTNVLTGQAANGCDSIVILNLTVLPPDTTFITSTTCNAQQVGVFTEGYISVDGCDSLVQTTVTFVPLAPTTIDTTICENEVYYFSGATSTFDSTGTYIDTLYGFAQGGCDSVIITNLTVLSVDTSTIIIETCDSSLLGTTFNTYTGQNGCDSVVRTIYFAPASVTQTFQNIAICPGDTFTMGNNNYTIPGTYIDTIYQPNSCYFLVNTELTYRDIDTTYIQSTTCSSINVGVNTSTLTGSDGCDSVVIETVSYAPPTGTIVDTTICSGQTYYISGSGIYDSTGIYIDTLYGFGQGGCDSVVITNLTVLPPDTTFLTNTTCNPQGAGVFIENYVATDGCDSLVQTTVTFVPLAPTTIDTSICSGSSYTSSGGGIFNSTGTYIDTLYNATQGGCDSVVITNLTVLPPDTFQVSSTTCDSTLAGVFVNAYTSTQGCDSIEVLTVTYIPPSITVVDTAICEGSTYFVFDPNGQTPVGYSIAGTYTDILQGQAASGCDSIVISNLTIIPKDTVMVPALTCDSSQVGNFTEVFTNQAGCDSVVITQVTLAPIPVAIVSGDTTICAGDSVQLVASGGLNFTWSPVAGLSDPNIANPMASPNDTTTYTVYVSNAEGCIDSAQVTVNVPTPLVANILETGSIACNGNANGVLQANVTGGAGGYIYQWNTTETSNSIGNLSIGFYALTVTDANGCTDSASYTLTQPNLFVVDSLDITEPDCGQFNGSITVQMIGGSMPYSYVWSNGDSTISITNLGPGTFDVTITDANGCTATSSATLSETNLPMVNSVIQNVDCAGDSTGSIMINMAGGTAPYTFNWNDGDTSSMRTDLFAGYYFLTVTDANGCHVTHADTVTGPTPVQLMFQQVAPTCEDSTGSLTVLPTGGFAPYTYLWNTGDSTQVINNLPQGYYEVTVTDANGCEAVSSQLFLNAGLPIADFSVTIMDGTVSFDNNSLNVINYLWNFGNGDTSAQVEPTITYDTSGTYTVTLIVSNSCGSDTVIGTVTVMVSDVNTVLAENIKATIVPNPNRGQFRLEVDELPIGEWQLEIYSITGQLMQREIRMINQSNAPIPVELRDVGAGMYLLRMVNEDGIVITRKFIVDDND